MKRPNWFDPAQCLSAARANIGAVPTVRIDCAWRNIGASGSGYEEFRRVAYAPRGGDVEMARHDAERLLAPGSGARERRARVTCEVPVGTLVQRFVRRVYRGMRGRYSVSFGVVVQLPEAPAKGAMIELKHRTLRSRPVYEVTLPTGELCFVRRDV